MFTGIIEELGKIRNITSNRIEIECSKVLEGTKLGDSIAVNGVCLTVVKLSSDTFIADISPETLNKTNFAIYRTGDSVNLERAMAANGRFGGHIVSGHIDGIARVIKTEKIKDFYDFKIELNPEQEHYVVKKGSISVDGISLTVANIDKNIISIAVIPHTFEKTDLKTLKVGSFVNIEVDITAKYIEKFLSTSDNKSRIDLEFLQEHGF